MHSDWGFGFGSGSGVGFELLPPAEGSVDDGSEGCGVPAGSGFEGADDDGPEAVPDGELIDVGELEFVPEDVGVAGECKVLAGLVALGCPESTPSPDSDRSVSPMLPQCKANRLGSATKIEVVVACFFED